MAISRYHNENWVTDDIQTATTGEAIAFARACVVKSSGTIVKCTADTNKACGLTVDSYSSGAQGEYIAEGTLRFVGSGDIAENDPLCPDDGTAGRIRTAISGDWVIGRAREVSADGEFGYGDFDFNSGYLMA